MMFLDYQCRNGLYRTLKNPQKSDPYTKLHSLTKNLKIQLYENFDKGKLIACNVYCRSLIHFLNQ